MDWFFYSHFLDRARAALAAGYEVVVVTAITRHDDSLALEGVKIIGIPFKRRSLSPLELWRNLREVMRVLKQERPDIVHLVAIKPILIGSVACRLSGIKRVISAVVGLGFAYSSDRATAKIMRKVLSFLFRVVLDKRHSRTVFENTDDLNYFLIKGWVRKENAVLIRGAGVDTERFRPIWDKENDTKSVKITPIGSITNAPQTDAQQMVMLLSRMLWDKGVGEFVDAARILRDSSRLNNVSFVLVGDPDDDNRGTISREQLIAWQEQGVIQWWGYREDVEHILGMATISCLPSYREGLPKSLLESLAMGLPCIATDVPGCREAVVDGVNGYLVPARDPVALAQAIERLLNAPDLLVKFAFQSRKMALKQFSREIVNAKTLHLYKELLPLQNKP